MNNNLEQIEEKILIKGEFEKTNIWIIILKVLTFISLGFTIVGITEAIYWGEYHGGITFFIVLTIALYITNIILQNNISEYKLNLYSELIISNNMVYGKMLFGRKITLPIDMISSIVITRSSLTIATASDKFTCIKCTNKNDVCNVLYKILCERQNKK